ncbi:MAG: cyclic nucleotide-binding domain-containing protein [Planctomycetota bacterium]|jgi:Fe-S-cluster-containing dehydrogenase component/CRP-like cAMP-binding protein
MAEAMLPAELAEVTDPLDAEDELLTADELAQLDLFEALKKQPSFARFPGTTVLRKCRKGRVLVRQGDAGATAYSILTTEDVIELREQQLESVEQLQAKRAAGEDTSGLHLYYESLSDRELKKLQSRLNDELGELRKKAADLQAAKTAPNERHVATAHLVLGGDDEPKRGLLHRLLHRGGSSSSLPAFIPIDGPADINSKTRQAPLHEGELFGEMSCMNRAPRSATVIAAEDCYLLEMLRNVLDMLHNDPQYKDKLDEIYRTRVLDGHVRRLPIFRGLSEDDFSAVKERIELVDYEAGSVIFEEHDDSDSFFVIRSGLVKVVANAWTQLRASEFKPAHWKALCGELVEKQNDPIGAHVWAALPETAQKIAADSAKGSPNAEQQSSLIDALNSVITGGTLHTTLGKTTIDVCVAIDDDQLAVDCEHFPDETKKWSELEVRTFHRSLLEFLYPAGVPRRAASSGARRTLSYMGRGDAFGELGVVTNSPRSATIFAYDHPDGGAHQRLPDSRTGAVPSRVELVKIAKDDFLQLVNQSSVLKSRVDEIVAGYQAQDQKQTEAVGDPVEIRSQSPEFEQLGLVQGQRLMLIDLDRCTRCGQCVDACVTSHADGRTRLYLDGPRFEKYLVPLSCRSCLDPVCMIGCPVGSINRGDNGEIQIRDWCIGCSLCADQCPYGSIQMNSLPGEIQLSPSQLAAMGESDIKTVNERAVVCDLCSSLPSKQPSCVYACPHDAAMRVNALEFFFETSS